MSNIKVHIIVQAAVLAAVYLGCAFIAWDWAWPGATIPELRFMVLGVWFIAAAAAWNIASMF